jgi:hypothetical protein
MCVKCFELLKTDDLSGRYDMQRTFTQMDILNEDICGDIEYYMQYLLDELRQIVREGSLELDLQQVDLVIAPKVKVGADTIVCCYYFANHCDRSLFWLDEHNIEDILSDCKGVNISHIGGGTCSQWI